MKTDALEWWKNRSLLYLCRGFDNLGSGDDYDMIMPATQISLVFDNLFPDEEPEFYAKYRLLNVRTHKAYTGNFGLNVLYLRHSQKASKEDIENDLVYWAEAFRAATWNELKAVAQKAETQVFREVAEKVYEINADSIQRELAEAHEKYVCTMATVKNVSFREGLAEGRAEMQAELNASRQELNASRQELNEKDARIAELERLLAEKS